MAEKNKKKMQLPFRLNILFILVFLVFSGLILRLGYVQILHGESYQEKVDSTTQDVVKIPVPRGKMYDRYGNIVVDNKALYAITYTPTKGVQADDRLDVAEKLSKYIKMYNDDNKKEKMDSITERDLREFWYLNHADVVDKRIKDLDTKKMDNGEVYNAKLDAITDDEISELNQHDLDVILIKKEMDKAQTMTQQIIKNKHVTTKEYAQVAEHLNELPGVNVATDWDRTYPYGDLLTGIFGSVTSRKQGIPKEGKEYYLTRGYNSNDRVGKSGLEEEYEDLLRGRKEQLQYTTTKNGQIVGTDVKVKGKSGDDLVLTIDMELQKKVDKILKEELSKVVSHKTYSNQGSGIGLAILMNPKTGELLTVAGQEYDRKTKKFKSVPMYNLFRQYTPGSAVKGATVLSGYQSGAIKPGTVFVDQPIKFGKGGKLKSSWKNLGPVNDLQALKYSSNVYMWKTALRMGGEYNYHFGHSIYFTNKHLLQDFRYYFNQFGLGVPTRIDFPHEGTGYKGVNPVPGNLVDFAIGQYDSYTMMQLVQYAATIANDGYRVKPHFLKEVRDPAKGDTLGPVRKVVQPDVLNKVIFDDKLIKRVQKGFHMAYHSPGGTAYADFHNKPYDAAGKTGTAQTKSVFEKDGPVYNTVNHTLIGYAPYDDPEVTMALIVPHTAVSVSGRKGIIGARIMDAYFDLKNERAKKKDDK